MGKGVNSACDDLFFINGHDPYSAFLSSDRRTGVGGFDIYSAYFKEKLEAISSSSGPAPFISTAKPIKREDRSSVATPDEIQFQISALLFANDSEELTAEHKEVLNKTAEVLTQHPNIELNILSFTDYEGPRKYDLYFALKRAETVGQYLIQQGVAGERLYITACGSAYPVYIKLSESQPDPSPNQRIDLRFSSSGGMPVRIEYDPKVPIDELENTPYQKDIMGALVNAYNKQGIDVYLYFSIIDWNHPNTTPVWKRMKIKKSMSCLKNLPETNLLNY